MLDTKVCFKCQKELPIDDFYKHPRMADGRLGKCKSCTKSDVSGNRRDKVDYYRNYDQARNSSPDRVAARFAYQHSDRGREVSRPIKKAWADRNPRKRAAQILFRNRLRNAPELGPFPCIHCGAKAHAHHENYDKPLDVVWLCPLHHKQRHKEMKKKGIEP